MKYGEAVERAINGKVIARKGWNGKDMFVFNFFFAGLKMKADEDFSEEFYDTTELNGIIQISPFEKFYELQPFLVLKTAQNTCVPWAPSQSDIFADDWYVVGEGAE